MSHTNTRRSLLRRGALSGAALLSGVPARAQSQAPAAATAAEARRLMRQMLGGFRVTQMLHVVARLGVADHLKDGPRHVHQLAEATGAHADSLYRILRALSGTGVFVEGENRTFRLNPPAELLRTGVPGSVRNEATYLGLEQSWKPWGALTHSVHTGETAFRHVFGQETFEWYKEHQAEARNFDAFQAEMSLAAADSVARGYDFSGARRIVDVGGGAGVLLAAILRKNPQARGVLFDLDHVARSAQAQAAPDIASRCEFVGGDFFQSVPAGGDVYLMKYIIHDWDDAKALAILGSCRKAMAGRGKLVLMEGLVCGPNQQCRGKATDITMLVATGGRNRTQDEYRALLEHSGFGLARVLPADEELSLMEAEPKA